jgi:hypothetical protein
MDKSWRRTVVSFAAGWREQKDEAAKGGEGVLASLT